MQEALERVDEEVNKTVEKSDILEYLAFSTYMVSLLSYLFYPVSFALIVYLRQNFNCP